MQEALDAEVTIESYVKAIDRYHINERLGKVLKVTEKSTQRRKELLDQWNDQFDYDDETIDHIEEYISQKEWHFDGEERDVLIDNLTYINNNRDRIRYRALREANLTRWQQGN
jgi:hypothetical protein